MKIKTLATSLAVVVLSATAVISAAQSRDGKRAHKRAQNIKSITQETKKPSVVSTGVQIGDAISEPDSIRGKRYVADEVVAVVGSSMVLLSDLEMAVQFVENSYREREYTGTNPRGEAFEALLLQKLMSSQAALDSLPVNDAPIDRETERQINELITSKGSVKKVEEFFNRPIFNVRAYIRRKNMEGEMAQAMQRKIEDAVKVSPSEVGRYARGVNKDSLPTIPEQYVYAQIVKTPPVNDKTRAAVKQELMNIRDRISKGASFGGMARMFSEDPGSYARGGEMDPQPAESFVGPFASALESLKPGQISEVVETPFGFHIIEVMEKIGKNYRVRHILKRIKFDGEQEVASMNQLDSVATEIRNGKLKFEDAVAIYSDDEGSKNNDGVVINNLYENYGARMKGTSFFMEELRDDYKYIRGLKPGEISPSFSSMDMQGNSSVKIVMLKEIIPSHVANIDIDYTRMEDAALAEKKRIEFEKWLNKKIAAMYIKIEEPYRSTINFTNKNWIK